MNAGRTVRNYSGLLAGVIFLSVFLVLRSNPGLAEKTYGEWIYPIVRWLFDHSLGLLPLPVIYVLLPALLLLLLWPLRKPSTRMLFPRRVLNVTGWLLAAFYLLWGFNYARPTLMERLNVEVHDIEDQLLINLGSATVSQMNTLRKPALLDDHPDGRALDQMLQPAVRDAVASFGISLSTSSRTRHLSPAGVLRKFGITGIYMPFTGSGLLEKAHPHPEKAFVVAHELAHSFGVTDEGEANLIAYLAGARHSDPRLQYAAHLGMWEYLMVQYRQRSISAGLALEDQLSSTVQEDLAHLRAERRRYREWIPNLGETFNDAYLKMQGVDSGTVAYTLLPAMYLSLKQVQNPQNGDPR